MCCQSSDIDCNDKKKSSEEESINENQSGGTKNKSLKNEGKIRLFFYGENLLNKLINQTFIQRSEKKIRNTTYIEGRDLSLNWEFFIFDNINQESNEIIADFIDKDFIKIDFYDIIIVTVKHLLDEDSLLFFKYFEKYSEQKSKQPFILYITKEDDEPKVEQLYDKITNAYFDKRTLYALKYPTLTNENENKKILELICKFRNYYHEEGDSFQSFNEEISSNYKFNILICGRAGTGKSTFINEFLGNRRAKEGEGLSVTHKIVTFCHEKYPINISDTPGFEDEYTLKKVKSLLDLYNKKLIDGRKKINLIIYLFPYSERSVLGLELELLENLMGYNTEIIFVMNHVTESIKKSHYKRMYNICMDSLKKIFPKNFNIKLYPINLISQINDDNPDNLKLIKSFGLDNLFKEIYNIFESSITNIEQIKKIKSLEELFWFFGNNKLFNHFKEINDLFISFRSELINHILSYGRLNKFSYNKDKNMKDLANFIYITCLGKRCLKYEEYLLELEKDNNVEKLFDEFTEEINLLKSYDRKIHTMYFYSLIHDHKTLALGYLCMKDIQKIFEKSPNIFMENDKLNFDLIINLCQSYNLAINGFKLMADDFEKIYQTEINNFNKLVITSKFKNNKDEKEINEMSGLKDKNEIIIDNKIEIKKENSVQHKNETKEIIINQDKNGNNKINDIDNKSGFTIINCNQKDEIKERNTGKDNNEIINQEEVTLIKNEKENDNENNKNLNIINDKKQNEKDEDFNIINNKNEIVTHDIVIERKEINQSLGKIENNQMKDSENKNNIIEINDNKVVKEKNKINDKKETKYLNESDEMKEKFLDKNLMDIEQK